jgi:(p)ppGpp synthase/HD superfamily hydrolase
MTDLTALARDFAREAHAGQTRKGAAQEPYAVHLEEVAAFVLSHGGSDIAVAAAWLHDTVEDCGVTPEEIARRFGPQVAAVVAELTDDKSLPKPERKRLQLARAAGRSADAALVKIGDKTSNVGAIAASPPLHWDRARCLTYVDWAEAVVAALPGIHTTARTAFAAVARDTRNAVAARG